MEPVSERERHGIIFPGSTKQPQKHRTKHRKSSDLTLKSQLDAVLENPLETGHNRVTLLRDFHKTVKFEQSLTLGRKPVKPEVKKVQVNTPSPTKSPATGS